MKVATRSAKSESITSPTSLMRSPPPLYAEAKTCSQLADESAVVNDLEKVEWAFKDEDTSFLTHDLHPYPAKFIPHIPGHLIARLSLRGDLVMDPFGGSGTTALEAIRLGRRALSADTNFVGVLAGRVKTCRLTRTVNRDVHAIRSRLLAHKQKLPSAASIIKQHAELIPDIPNRTKWFDDQASAELALIRASLACTESAEGRDIGLLAMSRIMLKASFQDSETRYTAKPRRIRAGEVLTLYIASLDWVYRCVQETAADVCYGVAEFAQADTRALDPSHFPDASVDLVVTSPPYGNAMDYHLYHRFRLFWLGADPRKLGRMEIGSHLRHQKESTGHPHYREEMGLCINQIARVLRPSRYAAIVIGDSIYKTKAYSGAELVRELGESCGFRHLTTIERPLHKTKRSFVAAGRRATSESIVILRKPSRRVQILLDTPPYRPWPYEESLRRAEIESLSQERVSVEAGALSVKLDPIHLPRFRHLTFTHRVSPKGQHPERTWQAVLENGLAHVEEARKDPKYVTHGLHPYKGKFYPQLASSLLNIAGVRPGGVVFDPFCGSGTTLLEGYLRGLSAHGCDMNPLAAKIARSKVGVLDLDPALVSEAAETLQDKIAAGPNQFKCTMHNFPESTHEEILSWFPKRVIGKLDWLVSAIRSVSAGVLQDYLEVILSSIVREVSHQDPTDLRIRRRKIPLTDADVLGRFSASLQAQHDRLIKFWSVRGYSPSAFVSPCVASGDVREWATVTQSGLSESTADLVLTSPPYATALPYVDTDRLSILLLCGLDGPARRPIEQKLTGSRDIVISERRTLEAQLHPDHSTGLPESVDKFLRHLQYRMTKAEVGFRRRNMPALLLRFFLDMHKALKNVRRVLKPGCDAFVVIGDNITSDGEEQIRIHTTKYVSDIAADLGMSVCESVPITVTTENMVHQKNAIKENVVLRLRR